MNSTRICLSDLDLYFYVLWRHLELAGLEVQLVHGAGEFFCAAVRRGWLPDLSRRKRGLLKFIRNNFNFIVYHPFQRCTLTPCQILMHPTVLSISLIVRLVGERAWQLRLERPLVAAPGDRLVIRQIAPPTPWEVAS